MKTFSNKTHLSVGIAILVLAFAVLTMAFPTQAHADYMGQYGYGGSYACSNPSVSHTGFYYCPSTPSYPTPIPQPYPYPVPVPVPQYPQLSVSCYTNTTSASTGSSVAWTASAYGGTGAYTYSWNGTDAFYGSNQTAYMTYYNQGTKTASVVVYSGNQTATAYCSNSVTVYSPYNYSYPTYYQQTPVVQYPPANNIGLDVGCFADPATARVNQPVTWNVEVQGGIGQYTYSWTGSDGLSGSQSSVIKYYDSVGDKSAIVTVTSADGRTGTRACSNTVKVQSSYVAPANPVAPITPPVVPTDEQGNGLSAASLFSLSHVPWGWVAVLVILVLFGTVMYLLFNRPKI